ncbi:hypothetical protein BS636_00220 [Acinetobacter sp. LoGeW2-3]|uniref:Lnb N-terminal periplasmic domain-containing protein n=1 Tax=Acinetobacter sp. LoGeW2-3 TaxID=1808001 RepID=UPI000C05C92D|nr:DUF4105 domain-containing protein [Acinetobacter sp. LoGeW2-3]ATO18213.1 hypothetical protein BS636_00220 [Acinetobacter sp. LoGeW2-3]
MKLSAAPLTAILLSCLNLSVQANNVEEYIQQAEELQLDKHITWQRLMYADQTGQSEVSYREYFYHPDGQRNLKAELVENIKALFAEAVPNQSIQCRFPARSQFLIQSLKIPVSALARADCPELDDWLSQIKPYKATLIYATDFMGNPSSMFGHTLLRLDPKDQAELNLVSYAVNYAATVEGEQSWSYAWKGLTGQYPGEYSLMPYYRKVKEYGDFESRDLWEYELTLSPEETKFLVQHIWEMKHVQFPYYFVQDNCAYRLLGLIDLVRPEVNLQKKFKVAAIPVETIKAIEKEKLISDVVYRPALETQLNAQAKQHGNKLARTAHRLTATEQGEQPNSLASYDDQDQAKILEMAYDDLYLQFIGREVDPKIAQPKLRQLLIERSQLPYERQRLNVPTPEMNPVQGHAARNLSIQVGEVQGNQTIEIGHRQAYHDLMDPLGGYRIGTQLVLLDGSLQYREDRLKLEHLELLTVNAYSPVTPFKMPLSWGFNLGWQQMALENGQFSEQEQHGVLRFKTQFGYSQADQDRKHLCYAQVQNHVQFGKALDEGWRVGIGPTVGCQNSWTPQVNSLVQVELPYWEDSHQWMFGLNAQTQYALDMQNAIRIGWQYQQQGSLDWQSSYLQYIHYF